MNLSFPPATLIAAGQIAALGFGSVFSTVPIKVIQEFFSSKMGGTSKVRQDVTSFTGWKLGQTPAPCRGDDRVC